MKQALGAGLLAFVLAGVGFAAHGELSRPYAGGSPLPMMGYTVWGDRLFYSTEHEVWGLIDCIKTNRLDRYGWKYVLPDDLEIRPGGGIQYSNGIPHSPNYPSGFANLFERCHTNGLKLGWYMDVTHGYDYYAPAADFLRTNHCDYVHLDFGYDSPHTLYAELAALVRTNREVPPVVLAAVNFSFPDGLTNNIFEIADVWDLLPEYLDPVSTVDSVYNNFQAVVRCADRIGPGSIPFAMPALMGWGRPLYRTAFALSCITSSALIVNCFDNVRDPFWGVQLSYPPCTTNLELIAIDQDPLVAGPRKLSDTNRVWTLYKPLANGDVAISVFNYNTNGPAVSATVPFAACGLTAQKVFVRDTFCLTNIGVLEGEFTTPAIAPGETGVFRLMPFDLFRAPSISAEARPDALHLRFTTYPGGVWWIQSSGDLVNWSNVKAVRADGDGVVDYAVTPASGPAVRFYRAALASPE